MSATTITTSPNIASLSLKAVGDLCAGIFYLDIQPSVWIGSGESNVLGANFQVTNPLGVVVKPFGSNYEIAPALSGGMDAVISFAVPTVANGYQLGKYTIDVELYDANGTRYTNTKYIQLCAPTALKQTLKYGNLSARLIGNCQTGKLSVIVDSVPNYNGTIVESQVNDFTLEYPTASGLAPIEDTAYGNFSVPLFEGVYLLTGTICATYNFGDNIFVKINYKVKKEHNQRCLIDLCCVNDAFASLREKLNSDCSDKEKSNTASIIGESLFLLESATLAANCGEDPSDIISQLEELLGCTCTCNCNEGAPIINSTPVSDSIIEGCGFTSEQIGLTTVYTLNNYSYVVAVTPNGGALTINNATLADCTKTQTIAFNIAVVYAQIKNLAINDACAWAAIVRKCFTLNMECLGFDASEVLLMTFEQILQAMIDAICNGTAGACKASIDQIHIEQVGLLLKFTWNEINFGNSIVGSVDLYLNNVFITNVLSGVEEYSFDPNISTGGRVTYKLVPRCANGNPGNEQTGSYTYLPRVFVAPPIVYSPYLQGTIPYDLTTNVEPLPLGIVAEWHFANNTNAGSLVSNPTNANPGTYFVFAKDTNNFYSDSVQVQLTADLTGSCTAPQNLQIVPQFGGNQVKFQSAAYPPPSNSYTVKRRLTSDSDIPANYTTIGAPAWNASISRWVISDNSAVNNQLYTYRAFSNCGTTLPYIDAQYAAITCPLMVLTPKVHQIDYFMFPPTGAISKVEVTIYSDAGSTVVHTDTHLAGFPSTISGSMVYLDPNKTYYMGVKVYIGTYFTECALQAMTTLKDTATLTLDYIGGKFSLQLSNPISELLNLKVANVSGFTDACVTPSGETDLLTSDLIIPAGSLGAELDNDGLTYHSVYYRLTNSAGFLTYGTKVNGDTFTVADCLITMQINHITCGFYPA